MDVTHLSSRSVFHVVAQNRFPFPTATPPLNGGGKKQTEGGTDGRGSNTCSIDRLASKLD